MARRSGPEQKAAKGRSGKTRKGSFDEPRLAGWVEEGSSSNMSFFFCKKVSMRAFRLLKTSLQQLDAELTSRSLTLDGTLGGLNRSGTINAAGSTGEASWSANTAAAGSTNNPSARHQNPPEAPLVTPPAARRKEVPCAPTIWVKMITDTDLYALFLN